MLSLPEQQRVEIVRVLLAGARVLIFDEPTSSLPAQEINALFAVFRHLRDDGYPVVVITHKMPEVFAVADTVTVMRRGSVVATVPIKEVDEQRLVELMFGEEPPAVTRVARPHSHEAPLLVLENVIAVGEGRPLVNLDLEVRSGEIVGAAGVGGNGQHELGDAIIGLSHLKGGRRLLFGQDASHWSVRRIREAGVGFVPESALDQCLIWSMTLEDNVLLGARRFSRFGGLSLKRHEARDELEGRFTELGLNLPSGDLRAGTLSGGNAQRFALARELAEEPKLIVLLYPTHGLDVPTAAAVQHLLLEARDRGAGILLVSQDLQELRALSDRLLVMRQGRIVAELPPDADPYEIGRLMTGGESTPAEELAPPIREGVAV
jgi:ABC-type uncharacterized transport system ATPase subunit